MQMDRRSFLKVTAGTAAVLVLPACEQDREAERGQRGATEAAERPTLRIAGGPFGFPSPFAYNGGPGYQRMSYIYDTLLWTDASGALLPWLASRYERSGDGLTYTFELRDDVRWHDGQPVTAEDVAFTFDYFARQPFLPPLVIAQPFGVAGARATGPQSVEIRLQAPAVTFARYIAGAVPIIPRHVWERVRNPVEALDPQLLVGSGPYRLQSFSPEQGSYLYVANDGFFLGTPFVRRIEMVPAPDEVTALRAGDLDGGSTPVEGVTPSVLAPFRDDPAFEVIEERAGFTFPLYWNLARGGALADARFRQGMARAIDRDDIVQRLLGGNGTPGNPGFLPPGHPFHVDVEQYSFDLDAANRLLDEAGYERGQGGIRQGRDGRPLRFNLTIGATMPPALTDLLVTGVRRVGVELQPRVVDLPRMFETKMRGDFDMLITLYPGPSGPGLSGDPDYLRTIYSSEIPGFHSVPGYRNATVDQLAARQLITANEDERRGIIEQLQRAVAGDLPVLPLYYSTLFFAYRSETFDQWYYTPQGGFGPGVVLPHNKHAFVTGRRTGLEVRPVAE